MVDAIGANGAKAERVTRIAAATPAVPVATPPQTTPSKASVEAGALAQVLAAEPPVDLERVAKIKRAIATGSFPILPATIADRLLALKLEWSGDDAA